MQRKPNDSSPFPPTLTRPDLFENPEVEEAFAFALSEEVRGRALWFQNLQAWPDRWAPEGGPMRTSHRLLGYPFYEGVKRTHPDSSRTLYGIRTRLPEGLSYFRLQPSDGILWQPASQASDELSPLIDELFENDPGVKDGHELMAIVAQNSPWGSWSIVLAADLVRRVEFTNDQYNVFQHRFVRATGDIRLYLDRPWVQRLVRRRLAPPLSAPLRTEYFSSDDEQRAFALLYYNRYIDDFLYDVFSVHNMDESVGYKEMEPGITDRDTFFHQRAISRRGRWRIEIERNEHGGQVTSLEGPDLDLWWQNYGKDAWKTL